MAIAPDAPRTRRTWDVVLAITFLVLLIVLAAVLGFAGAFLVMASDSCGASSTCRTDALSLGVFLAMLGPAVVAVVAVASVVERLVRARLAFWPPLVGVGAAALLWAGGAALVFSSVSPSRTARTQRSCVGGTFLHAMRTEPSPHAPYRR